MDLDEFRFERAFERDDAWGVLVRCVGEEEREEREGRLTLDQERIRVFKVDMHNGHHPNSHKHRLVSRAQLRLVVRADGCGCEFRLLAGHGRCGLHVFQCRVVYPSNQKS